MSDRELSDIGPASRMARFTDLRMQGSKSKVKSRYPDAAAEHQASDFGAAIWEVWSSLGKGGSLLGLGCVESEAWYRAVQAIENQEGRRLPLAAPSSAPLPRSGG